ncbi:concanavalin A-like lectin/glucanase domain-containing protein [Fennellomyces sp. T-0311]|nr:concanavalin A-like lectin/glucanase domain-containing protein [Fennellomyces sp. T-0311]
MVCALWRSLEAADGRRADCYTARNMENTIEKIDTLFQTFSDLVLVFFLRSDMVSLSLYVVTALLAWTANADKTKSQYGLSLTNSCDCGYSDQNQTWSDMWHLDFQPWRTKQTIRDIWLANYQIDAKWENSRSRQFDMNNVYLNTEGGLQLAITVQNNTIRCAGFGTQRQDFLYGSFRAYLRTTNVNGTVASMYIFNTQEEIDIEILSAVAPPQSYFAIHPGLLEQGRASHLTHDNHHLGFDPSAEFHEYRFDWMPNLVIFYIDGIEARRMVTNVPSLPGRLMFNHWSDGNPNFSKGPPERDAIYEVMNITAFFNYSIPDPQTGFNTTASAKCAKTQQPCNIQGILDYLHATPPDNQTGMSMATQLPPEVTRMPTPEPTSITDSAASLALSGLLFVHFIVAVCLSLWLL